MKKFFKVFICLLLLFSFCACKKTDTDDIIIIYTSDVHSSIDENIGYAGLVAYQKQCQQQSKYVTMVDVGDAIQGAALSTVSKGDAIAECLNVVNYDIQMLGNHEFDYGLEKLSSFLNQRYINSNVVYTGTKKNSLNALDKYRIIEYGKTKVGYIALLTPRTISNSSPNNFKEDGIQVIDFFGGKENNDFYNYVQNLVNEVKEKGADYVIALTHFGCEEENEPYTSMTLASSTYGIDVIIDAHSHVQYSCKTHLNSQNKQVLITSCGTQLESIGQVTISQDGFINATNITEYSLKDEETSKQINAIKDRYIKQLTETLFTNNTPLSIKDENGIRTIRNKEMPIGDFVADAFRYVTNSQIAIVNGGGVRASLSDGAISFTDIMNVTPYGNIMCSIELTGQELIDYLEYTYRITKLDYITDNKNNCEYGSFMQVSGIKLTIDTSITSDVVVDDDDNFVSVGEVRRIKDVFVMNENNEYEPIDLEKTYIIGSINYILLNGGSGTEIFFKDKKVVISDAGTDYEALYKYISEYLDFDLSKYKNSDNRITLK